MTKFLLEVPTAGSYDKQEFDFVKKIYNQLENSGSRLERLFTEDFLRWVDAALINKSSLDIYLQLFWANSEIQSLSKSLKEVNEINKISEKNLENANQSNIELFSIIRKKNDRIQELERKLKEGEDRIHEQDNQIRTLKIQVYDLSMRVE